MEFTITINGEDKSSLIERTSVSIEKNESDQPSRASFIVKTHTGQTFKPAVNDEVIAYEGAEKVFAGKILSIQNTFSGQTVLYRVTCKDYTYEADRVLVTENYEDMTVAEILASMFTTYMPDFTTTNCVCAVEVKKVVFNKKTVTRCIKELATLTNYHWYIDEEKDLHFFAKNSKPAPFGISDAVADSGNLVADSLVLNDDLSQLRNSITVRGAEKTSESLKTKTIVADGQMTTFETGYKFASKPSVTVAGIAKTVGIENIDVDGYDCYWNYNEKYVRFPSSVADTSVVALSGYPLIPIVVEVDDLTSIEAYGRSEYMIVNKSLKTSEEAQLFASAQADSYARSVREGRFRTLKSGLRAGQVLTINLTGLVNDSFIIQRVVWAVNMAGEGEWNVELATTRTLGIIKLLQDKLLNTDNLELNEDEVLERYLSDKPTITCTESVELVTPEADTTQIDCGETIAKDPFGAGVWPTWVYGPYVPESISDPKTVGRFDFAKFA